MDALGVLISVMVITIKLWIYTIPQPAIAWYSDQQILNMRPTSTVCVAAHLIPGTKATWFQVDAVYLDGNMVIEARTLFNTPAAWRGVVVAERLVLREDVPPSDVAVVQYSEDYRIHLTTISINLYLRYQLNLPAEEPVDLWRIDKVLDECRPGDSWATLAKLAICRSEAKSLTIGECQNENEVWVWKHAISQVLCAYYEFRPLGAKGESWTIDYSYREGRRHRKNIT
ncbi:hypothetical protein B0H13DRAFT_1851695 [Mycena leptocephala]|nr:hypothetical protein B0H13DRAFT_1851695 [Mycena leptocephala]